MNNFALPRPAEPKSMFWARWGMTAAWAGMIFYMSTEGFGASYTVVLIQYVLHILHLSVSPRAFEIIHHIVRKAAHCTEYAIFAIFIYHSLLRTNRTEWRLKTAALAVVIAGLYSLTDEGHQILVPGRTPALTDCGIDTCGATLGMLLTFAWASLFTKPKASQETPTPLSTQ